ncbi:hypothetical protein IE81DRAFT_332568 [Ceraceosorus guamensis]|uniref:Uncharacterized protein n=1 Tax=Ceraceosorus guamensis TaxID=1522189 RepID=A0A316VP64_9BASI|nr:hypothetical protein IE81DRAFT_332568 [Ceraceosorus guamensis]PWN39110.1 hypothetical protein IE81DRAFT_332568 [Ceraceosorus guamensis]
MSGSAAMVAWRRVLRPSSRLASLDETSGRASGVLGQRGWHTSTSRAAAVALDAHLPLEFAAQKQRASQHRSSVGIRERNETKGARYGDQQPLGTSEGAAITTTSHHRISAPAAGVDNYDDFFKDQLTYASRDSPIMLRSSNDRLWSYDVTSEKLRAELEKIAESVDRGARHLPSLASRLLHSLGIRVHLDGQAESTLTPAAKFEEACMLIFSHCIQRSAQLGMTHTAQQDRTSIRSISALYESQVGQAFVPTFKENPRLVQLQRSTLHSYFGLQFLASVRLQDEGMRNAALCVKDQRLKPSQARYLFRRVVARLEEGSAKDSSVARSFAVEAGRPGGLRAMQKRRRWNAAWEEAVKSAEALLRSGVLLTWSSASHVDAKHRVAPCEPTADRLAKTEGSIDSKARKEPAAELHMLLLALSNAPLPHLALRAASAAQAASLHTLSRRTEPSRNEPAATPGIWTPPTTAIQRPGAQSVDPDWASQKATEKTISNLVRRANGKHAVEILDLVRPAHRTRKMYEAVFEIWSEVDIRLEVTCTAQRADRWCLRVGPAQKDQERATTEHGRGHIMSPAAVLRDAAARARCDLSSRLWMDYAELFHSADQDFAEDGAMLGSRSSPASLHRESRPSGAPFGLRTEMRRLLEKRFKSHARTVQLDLVQADLELAKNLQAYDSVEAERRSVEEARPNAGLAKLALPSFDAAASELDSSNLAYLTTTSHLSIVQTMTRSGHFALAFGYVSRVLASHAQDCVEDRKQHLRDTRTLLINCLLRAALASRTKRRRELSRLLTTRAGLVQGQVGKSESAADRLRSLLGIQRESRSSPPRRELAASRATLQPLRAKRTAFFTPSLRRSSAPSARIAARKSHALLRAQRVFQLFDQFELRPSGVTLNIVLLRLSRRTRSKRLLKALYGVGMELGAELDAACAGAGARASHKLAAAKEGRVDLDALKSLQQEDRALLLALLARASSIPPSRIHDKHTTLSPSSEPPVAAASSSHRAGPWIEYEQRIAPLVRAFSSALYDVGDWKGAREIIGMGLEERKRAQEMRRRRPASTSTDK